MRAVTALRGVVCVPAIAILLLAGGAVATEEAAESEGAVCTACHDKPGSKRLTDRGKFFESTRSLAGYAEIEASFGQCTFCHRRKAGSKKLTRAGEGFAEVLGNMEGLVEWVRDRHPGWPEPGVVETAPGGGEGEPAGTETTPLDGGAGPMPSH